VCQRRGHQQVLGRDVEVELAHHAQVFEVALGDEGDRQIEDVQLVLLDQMQKQIERPLERGQLDVK